MHSCPNCGKEVSEDAAHCGHCGHQIEVVQKKTMMGLGAVDMEALKAKYSEAKAKREAAQSEATAEEDDNSLAKTELMDVVELPTPGQEPEPAPAKEDEEFVTAPTEAMDTVDAEAALAKKEELAATEETPQVAPAAGEGAAEEGGDDGGGRWEIGQAVAEAEPEPEPAPVEEPVEPEVADEIPSADPKPAARGPMEPAPAPAMAAGDVAVGGEAAAADLGVSAAQVGDGGTFDPMAGDEEGGSSKKMFIIIGAALFVFFGCCVVGPLIAMFTGVIGGG
jgi:DNA-directed RNA polymerase subunit RPC12/RpoP